MISPIRFGVSILGTCVMKHVILCATIRRLVHLLRRTALCLCARLYRLSAAYSHTHHGSLLISVLLEALAPHPLVGTDLPVQARYCSSPTSTGGPYPHRDHVETQGDLLL